MGLLSEGYAWKLVCISDLFLIPLFLYYFQDTPNLDQKTWVDVGLAYFYQFTFFFLLMMEGVGVLFLLAWTIAPDSMTDDVGPKVIHFAVAIPMIIVGSIQGHSYVLLAVCVQSVIACLAFWLLRRKDRIETGEESERTRLNNAVVVQDEYLDTSERP